MRNISIDGINIYTLFGIETAKSKGELDPLAVKYPYKKNWDDEHGEDVDLTTTNYEARKITLDFVFRASTKQSFYDRVTLFFAFLTAPGIRTLKYADIARPYFVYCPSGQELERLTKWNDTLMAGKISMTFIEPKPVGKYFSTTNPLTNASFTISTNGPVDIYWGDGTIETVDGTNVVCSHIYNSNLLGASGNCDSFSGYNQGIGTLITNDGADAALKCFEHASGGTQNISMLKSLNGFNYNEKWFISIYNKVISGTSGSLNLQGVTAIYNNITSWTRIGKAWARSIGSNQSIYLTNQINTTSRFDNFMINKITEAELTLLTTQQLLDKYAYNDGTTSSGAYQTYVGIVGDIADITSITSITGLTAIN
jgi:hypothetical protein